MSDTLGADHLGFYQCTKYLILKISLPPCPQKSIPLLQLFLLFLQCGHGHQQLHYQAIVQYFDWHVAGLTHRPDHYAERV